MIVHWFEQSFQYISFQWILGSVAQESFKIGLFSEEKQMF